jgi:hypothetical protein
VPKEFGPALSALAHDGGWFPLTKPLAGPTERTVMLSAERPRVKSVVAVRVIGGNRPGGAAVAVLIACG